MHRNHLNKHLRYGKQLLKVKRKRRFSTTRRGVRGRSRVIPTKPYSTQKDVSLAYSREWRSLAWRSEDNPDDAYKYTAKGNLVAGNLERPPPCSGWAISGDGRINGHGKAKGCSLKPLRISYVFDIEVDYERHDQFIETVKNISVTFGGIQPWKTSRRPNVSRSKNA